MAPLAVRRRTIFPNLFNRFSSSAPELKQRLHLREILRQKVFGSDLSEQLFPDKDLPEVVRVCALFVERNGISLSGIYRLSGISSNISRLRATFDSGETPDLESDDQVMADVHCVSSLLKLYFRLLPNPLMTFESYDDFVRLFRDDSLDDTQRLTQMRRLCRRLPPPHFRTLKALVFHLRKVSFSAQNTGMTAKNLSIVWAPNLLRSPEIESRSLSGDLAALQVIGIQAVLTEYLIQNCDDIFDDTITDTNDSPASPQLT